MFVWFPCWECAIKKYRSKGKGPYRVKPEEYYFKRVNNTRLYTFTCQTGHKNKYVHLAAPFQVCLDAGAYAFMEKDYRSTVVNFHTGYELFIDAISLLAAIKNGIKRNAFEKYWRKIEKSSIAERVAFETNYMNWLGIQPPSLSSSKVRNRVIHQGYFPKRRETVQCCNQVLDFIHGVLVPIYRKSYNHIQSLRRLYSFARAGAVGHSSTYVVRLDIRDTKPTIKKLPDVVRNLEFWYLR